MANERKIILLSEILESKIKKEQEIEYYRKQLEELTQKISWLQREVDITNLIIDMIESEKVLDIEKKLLQADE